MDNIEQDGFITVVGLKWLRTSTKPESEKHDLRFNLAQTLADAQTIAAQDDGLRSIPPSNAYTKNLSGAHHRAECEQRPVNCGNITIWPIGAKPKSKRHAV